MGKIKNLSGLKFSKLTAKEHVATDAKHRAVWRCVCECGKERLATATRLISGHTKSCGCTHGQRTHGQSFVNGKASPTYSSWTSMIGRCTHPSMSGYAYYKANGITICPRWRKFENFFADMGERPGLEFSLDRHPNQMGNYEPGNCRWATKREQANNRVTNVMFTYKGQEMTFAELVRVTGCDKERLRHRILRAGWSVEEAINRPHSQGQRVV